MLSTATKPWPHCDYMGARAGGGADSSPRLQSRGPITTPASGLHLTRQEPLHGYKAVAPLRRNLLDGGGGLLPPLHGYKAVAPLRPLDPGMVSHLPLLSPRLQSRGPIATCSPPTHASGHSPSPRLQSRGPIATSTRRTTPRRSPTLSTATKPWPHCDELGAELPRPRHPLHGYKAVAPLRLEDYDLYPRNTIDSPRLQSRGPIATAG